ncbi:MAG: helix-turn-helix transcriptional regulator [Lachnospiraceae bacterium]|nr:helix-turn-helix transcriptional regulator [Lachnospiraceae bacterium]
MYEKNVISKILYQNNMSYRELSRLSGISLSSLNDIANFKKEPKQSTMISIARALNMEVSEIFDLNWRK